MLDQHHVPAQDQDPPITPVTMKTSKKGRKRDLEFAAASEKLQTARQALGIIPETPNSFDDPVFVAIDFENTQAFRSGWPAANANCQVGIATFDTRDILPSSPMEDYISTYNLLAGSEGYEFGARSKYLFGEPSRIDPTDFLQEIKDCIPQDRNIFLVGHNIRTELTVLENIGFELQKGRLSGCLDTNDMGRLLFGPRFSLHNLLLRLKCPHQLLHNAGNDAHFTLRALILLATHKCPVREEERERLGALERLARSPIPPVSPYIAWRTKKAAENRAKRNASRKKQTLLWSQEKKDEIRAERAARRLREAGDDDLDDMEFASFMFA